MRTPTRSASRHSNANAGGSATRSRSVMSMSKSMDSKRDRPTPTPTPKEYPISPSPGAARRSQATTTTTTAAEEIPIDPALLEGQADVVGAETDMDDMEDAEGELVDDELDFMLHSSEPNFDQQVLPMTSLHARTHYPHSQQQDEQPITSSSSRPYPALPTKMPRSKSQPQLDPGQRTPISQPRNGLVNSSSSLTPHFQSALKRKRSQTDKSRPNTPQTNGHGVGRFSSSSSSLIRVGSTSISTPASKINGKGKGKGVAGPTLSPVSNVLKRNVSKKSVEAEVAFLRDQNCSFCGGTDACNAIGKPEYMVSCAKCGRSGHRTCLNMVSPRLKKKVMTYDWECIECKSCEHCQVKGDDSRLMFCDSCDRGWHSYCLNPPLAKPPEGKWHCPKCRPSEFSSSLLSAYRSAPTISNASSRKGKEKAILHDQHGNVTPTARIKKAASARATSTISLDDGVFEDSSSRLKVKVPRKRKEKDQDKDRDKDEDGKPGKSKARGRGRPSQAAKEEDEDDGPPMIVRLRVPSGSNKRAAEEESEEEQIPYGGIITGDDADTSRTTITDKDKEAFEKSRKAAEWKLGGPPPLSSDLPGLPPSNAGSPAPSPSPGVFGTSTPGKATPSNHSTQNSLSRGLRDRLLHNSVSDPALGFPFPATPIQTKPYHPHHHPQTPGQLGAASSKPEKIKTIRFGPYEIDTWYSAPYPEEYAYVPEGKLWLCEFCLKYMKSGFVANRHRLKCKVRHPPGDEIYREGAVSVFEVDGRKNKIYCQNLCLLAKMFLDHKTLYYDVEPFLFYVMTEVDDLGARFVGYFSKEKRSMDNNVSCIMTLPVRQRKGWGNLLIDFSYLLSKKEGRVGSPEKPLSGLGAVTYKGYWRLSVFRYLLDASDNVTMNDISLGTSMTLEDIHSVLVDENMLNVLDSPPPENPSRFRGRWRGRGRGGGGRSSVNRRKASSGSPDDEEVKLPTRYTIPIDREYIQAVISKHDSKGYLKLRPERLKYHPFLVTRNPTLTSDERVEATIEAAGLPTGASQGQDRDADVEMVADTQKEEDEEAVIHGEDKATLELVATLSASPARSLRRSRKRPSEEIESPSRSVRSRMRSSVNASGIYAHPNGGGNEGSVSPTKPNSSRTARTDRDTGSPLSRRSMRGHQSLPATVNSVSPEKPKSLGTQGIDGSGSTPPLGDSSAAANASSSTGTQSRVSGGLSAARRKRIVSSEPLEENPATQDDDEEEEEEIENVDVTETNKLPSPSQTQPAPETGDNGVSGDVPHSNNPTEDPERTHVDGIERATADSFGKLNGVHENGDAPESNLKATGICEGVEVEGERTKDAGPGIDSDEKDAKGKGGEAGIDTDAEAEGEDVDAEGEDVDIDAGMDVDAEGEVDEEYVG